MAKLWRRVIKGFKDVLLSTESKNRSSTGYDAVGQSNEEIEREISRGLSRDPPRSSFVKAENCTIRSAKHVRNRCIESILAINFLLGVLVAAGAVTFIISSRWREMPSSTTGFLVGFFLLAVIITNVFLIKDLRDSRIVNITT